MVSPRRAGFAASELSPGRRESCRTGRGTWLGQLTASGDGAKPARRQPVETEVESTEQPNQARSSRRSRSLPIARVQLEDARRCRWQPPVPRPAHRPFRYG